jgi:hypothetical protein
MGPFQCICMYVHMLQVLTMRQYKVTCVILQHVMRQCAKVTMQPACHLVNDVEERKGRVLVLPYRSEFNTKVSSRLLFCVSNFLYGLHPVVYHIVSMCGSLPWEPPTGYPNR